MNNSSKGMNYKIFKCEPDFEKYLISLPKTLRQTLFYFRTGNNKLPVEVGRWRNSHLPYNERKCLKCMLNDIGDEYHYLLRCPYFTIARHKYIPNYYYTQPNILKFKELMTTDSPEILRNISLFTKHIISSFRNP
jgi:hypothetical protein